MDLTLRNQSTQTLIIILLILFIIWYMLPTFIEPYGTLTAGRAGIRGRARTRPRRASERIRGRTRAITRVTSRKRHAILTADNKLKSISGVPPTATTHCAQVECPPLFEDDVVCWKCHEIKAPDTGTNGG